MRNFLISLEIQENDLATLSLTSFAGIEYGNIKNFSYQCMIYRTNILTFKMLYF